eukprot:10453193-Alexandrium_andersonii.AAC.1
MSLGRDRCPCVPSLVCVTWATSCLRDMNVRPQTLPSALSSVQQNLGPSYSSGNCHSNPPRQGEARQR